MKYKNLFLSVLIVIAAIAVGGYLLTRQVQAPAQDAQSENDQDPSFTFACATEGKFIKATFHLPEDESVDISLSDGRAFSLPHALSADGARYANADESLVFWNKGDTAIIQENGSTTYDGCTVVQ